MIPLLKSETEDTKRSANKITLAARFCSLSILSNKSLSHSDQITLLKLITGRITALQYCKRRHRGRNTAIREASFRKSDRSMFVGLHQLGGSGGMLPWTIFEI